MAVMAPALGKPLPLLPEVAIGRGRVWQRLVPRGLSGEGLVLDQHIREGRFQRSLALVAGCSGMLSGLEVLYEHYRGSYSQRVMYSPIILSPALLGAGIAGALSRRAARTILPAVSLLTMLDAVVGFVFHVRGVARKPGGWCIPVFNVIMGPPVFAPLLFGVSGFLGLIATLLRREDDPEPVPLPGVPPPRPAWLGLFPRAIAREGVAVELDVREGRFQKGSMAVAMALSAFFSGVEALYSHYKNNFQYRAQWTPILLTPVLMAAGIGAVWSRTLARTLLPWASALALIDGAIGFCYHARGVLRRSGGRTLPFYNLMYGPPIFAPLLFAATGFLGLLASLLRRAD